jgi:hypothetical protein
MASRPAPKAPMGRYPWPGKGQRVRSPHPAPYFSIRSSNLSRSFYMASPWATIVISSPAFICVPPLGTSTCPSRWIRVTMLPLGKLASWRVVPLRKAVSPASSRSRKRQPMMLSTFPFLGCNPGKLTKTHEYPYGKTMVKILNLNQFGFCPLHINSHSCCPR